MSVASRYLQSSENNFWRYEDQGKVIAVPGGCTLGYTDQVIGELVLSLAPHGLPRFGSLLLATAATTSQGVHTLNDVMAIVSSCVELTEEINEGIWFAKLLTEVPAQFKKGDLRIQLLRAIFKNSHNAVSVKRSHEILSELKAAPFTEQYANAGRGLALTEQQRITQIARDFKTLAIIGRELTSVQAILKRIADLPPVQALAALELEPEQQEQEKSLINQLINHPETIHVGALVASLISGLQIPFHASLPSEQPLGGVADITNKGSFDKLLTSEYALDDHVLLSRLANGEALYKHREIPPADNVYPRVLLIDATLKNWGDIRTISFAAALAIAQHPKNKQPYRVFLVGKSYREIAFNTLVDVIDGLNVLDDTLDPGIGIEQLFSREDIKAGELFFLGTAASLKTPGMQRMSEELGKRIDHWIHPDERGVIKVYKNLRRGKRFVQELKVPLDKLWSESTLKNNKVVSTFFGTTNYPILFPEMKIKHTWAGDRFVYGLTVNNALMRLYSGKVSADSGWEFLSDGGRSTDILKAVITHEDLSVTALFTTDNQTYTVVSYPGGEPITIALDRRLTTKRTFYVEQELFKSILPDSTLCIDTLGHISQQNVTTRERTKKQKFHENSNNFFRKINQVLITDDELLRIRKHDLVCTDDKIYLHHRQYLEGSVKVVADEITPGTWTFPDGSSVVHNPDGMLTLVSANADLADVHLPTQLDVPLAGATADVFSGPAYYQKKYQIEIIINNASDYEPELIRIINECLDNVNLRRAEKMAKDGMIICHGAGKLARLESKLGGLSYRIYKRGLQQQEKIPMVFYDQYIKSFISHIVNHGTNA
ncbi:hypothetical protein [Neolewinella antarctica]|uniref:Uncharacterized protein n=1 Tax=Neolewinella antarctica TaxID=442734 RepID=A0ABX0XDY2_9BACT|nr:hypothetical protein [Neolewinella antarctica]NJC27104.1 hypothetical protein [Neolewinella antarctica]